MNLYLAPLQGYTDAAWRHFHREIYGGEYVAFTPFVRLEKGEPRSRDMRDYTSALNSDCERLIPQVIFRDVDELRTLTAALAAEGAREVNLNMGCPFALQTAKGRGSGILSRPEALEGLGAIREEFPGIGFSVKMRVGHERSDEWRHILPLLSPLEPRFVAVHPRTGRQQYAGELHLDEFEALLAESPFTVIYNGDILTPEDMATIAERYPQAAGLMAGRGIVGRPSLFMEYTQGTIIPVKERIMLMRKFHDRLLAHYSDTLCGESQILSKIKPFWEYAEAEIGRKPYKAIRKAGNMKRYLEAVASIRSDADV
ncbi:MAG: tRNA-dihydrouridine synthase family protein [Bacteroidales bacterium]|nr:tRNA-dihydrouridine synthase family protein [Bacteroidales bacterium]